LSDLTPHLTWLQPLLCYVFRCWPQLLSSPLPYSLQERLSKR
ncbi:unnamed protein product, partial [Ectocarpus fasciculatus]